MADDTLFATLPDLATQYQNASHALQNEFNETGDTNLTPQDQSFSDILESPAGYALLRTLERHGIDGLELVNTDIQDPRGTIATILTQGQAALKSAGIADLDLELYQNAADIAQITNTPLSGVVQDIENRAPLLMRSDLDLPKAIETLPEADISGPTLQSGTLTTNNEIFDKIVSEHIEGSNFCEMDTLSQFQHFLSLQPIKRGLHDDFIAERIADSWESLPEEIKTYEPSAKNVFGFETPYPEWVDDMGAHENNQRFFGGYHISTEKGHEGVDVHFDAADPLMGPAQNALHGYEVGLLKLGVIETKHYPELGAPLSEEGLAPDWDRYEDHCVGLE